MTLLVIPKLNKIFLVLTFSIIASFQMYATTLTWTGNESTEWNNPENWNWNYIPGPLSDVVIPTSPAGGRMPIISSATFFIQKLTIDSGATLTQIGGTFSSADYVSIFGSFIQNAGTFSAYKKITVAPGGLFSVSGSFSGSDVSVLPTAAINVNGSFTTNDKKITIDAAAFNQTGGTVLTRDIELRNGGIYNQSNSELKIEHDLKVSAGNTFNGTSGTVRFTGIAGAGADYSGNIQFHNVIIDSLADNKMSSSLETIKVSGNFTNNNLGLSQGKGKIIFNGSGDQCIYSASSAGRETFEYLEFNNTSGVTYLSSNIEVSKNVVVSNGIFDIKTYELKNNTAAGSLILNNNSELRIGGSYPTNFTTENFSDSSVVNYNGSSDQNVRYGFIRGTLRLEGSGTKTSGGNITVNANVYIAPGITFNMGGNALSVTGSVSNNGNLISTNTAGIMSFYSRQSGDLNAIDSWSNTGYGGSVAARLPGAVNSDLLIIGDGKSIAINSNINNLGTVRVESTGKLIAGNFIIGGNGMFDLRSGGTLVVGSPEGINISSNTGNVQTAIRMFGDSASFEYNGTEPQASGDGLSAIISDLTINNPSNVALSKNSNVSGNLNLVQGSLILGNNNLTLGANSSIVGNLSDDKMIIAASTGELRKEFTGIGSFTFPIGDNIGAAEYSPITLNFINGNFSSAYAGVKVVNSKHPQDSSNAHFINRYWIVNSNGISDFSCNVICTYTDQDIQPGADESNIYMKKFNSSGWTLLNSANTSLNELSGLVSSFSDFTGGETGSTTDIDITNDHTPATFAVSQNYPNPFNPSTRIRYQVSSDSYVSLKVFDVIGNEVATLVNENRAVGIYETNFDGSQLSSGVYFYQIKAGDFLETNKMILNR